MNRPMRPAICPRCGIGAKLLWRTNRCGYEFFVGCAKCGEKTAPFGTGAEALRGWDRLCEEHGRSRKSINCAQTGRA